MTEETAGRVQTFVTFDEPVSPGHLDRIAVLAERQGLDVGTIDLNGTAQYDAFLRSVQAAMRQVRLDYLEGPEPADASAWIQRGGR